MDIKNSYIFVDGLLLMVNIGTKHKERDKKQKIELSMKIWSDFIKAAETDNIQSTINYDDIVNTIREKIKAKQWNLLETFVKEIGEIIITEYKIKKIKLKAKKFILDNCKSTGVSLEITN